MPNTWVKTALGQVVPYGRSEKADPPGIPPEAWVLDLEDIERDSSRLLRRSTAKESQPRSTKNAFKVGDVLYGKLRPYLNKVVLADQPGYCTTEIVPLDAQGYLHQRYLFYWLKSPEFLDYVIAQSHGMNMPRLGTEAANAAPLVVPPLPEQQRIADKLDKLLARIDACRERLDGIPTLLARFRQCALSSAVQGRLTSDWRASRSSDGPAQAAALTDELKVAGWSFRRADEVCAKVQSGGTPKEGFLSTGGVPFLKVYNLVGQRVDFDYRPQFIAPSVHAGSMRKSITLPGDVLMNIVGPPLGKVALVPDVHASWNINQAITLFRAGDNILREWLYYVLCEGSAVRTVMPDTRGSVGQVNISLSQCRAFTLPVPPLDEQRELVSRLRKLLAVADRLDDRTSSAGRMVSHLDKAVLAKAFRGELVPQDPADEPAQALLDRLMARKPPDPPARRPGRRAAA